MGHLVVVDRGPVGHAEHEVAEDITLRPPTILLISSWTGE